MNLHLISQEEENKKIANKYFHKQKINIYKNYRYIEETHAARNNLHLEIWNNLSDGGNLVTEDASLINEGIIVYSDILQKYLNNFCKNWQILFLNSKSPAFWYNQKNVVRPFYANNWGGFGSFISQFMFKRIMESPDYKNYDVRSPLNLSLYLINKDNIDKTFSDTQKFDLCANSLETILYRNMHLYNMYIANPKINLTDSYFSAAQNESDICFRFSYPRYEGNIYKIPIIDKNYKFEFEISEDFVQNISFKDLERKLIFKVNSVVTQKPKLAMWVIEDPENNIRIRKIKFDLPEDLRFKLKKSSGFVSERNMLEICLNLNGQKICGKTIFSLKNIDKNNKY